MKDPGSSKKKPGGTVKTARNANILSFFQPVAQPRFDKATSSPAPAPASPSPHPPSSPPELPSTPPKPVRLEVGASDEEDDGGTSDDSLEDLSSIMGKTKNVVPAERRDKQNPYATPRAKRTAVEFHSSPLAIMPRHKFDMKALAEDARRDEATTASSLRVKDSAAAKTADRPAYSTASATGDTIADVVSERGGNEAQKVLRAVQRSEPSQPQPRYYFFEENYKIPEAPPAPKVAKTSPWSLLTQGSAKLREQHLISGLPQTVLCKTGNLPDRLFDWILDSLCIETSLIVRQEYSNMVISYPEQVERLLSVERLQQLFVRLGARDVEHGEPDQAVSKVSNELYEGRDWSCLQSFISLLGLVAGQLAVRSAQFATQTLIRLSLDKFLLCTVELLAEFEYTIQQLVAAIPSPTWDSFCLETCHLVNSITTSRTIKATALHCLPVCNHRTHDLRRRIAVSALFQDDTLGRHHPEDIITLRGLINHLTNASDDTFIITPNTDFLELRASIILLDIVIDDGGLPLTFDNMADEREFNEQVDELAAILRDIWRKINDSGMKLARTEAKSVVEWVQQRLLHGVRTRRKARKSVFDFPGQRQEDDPFLSQQRDYMKSFLKSKSTKSPPTVQQAASAPAPEIEENTIVVRGG